LQLQNGEVQKISQEQKNNEFLALKLSNELSNLKEITLAATTEWKGLKTFTGAKK